jgi:hypothetical protein
VRLAHAVYVVVWNVLEKGTSGKGKNLDSVVRLFGATECGESCMVKALVVVSHINL